MEVTQEHCREHVAVIKGEIKDVRDLVQGIDKRLFRDNGTLSVQTRLDRMERMVAMLLRVGWLLITAVVGQGGYIFWQWIARRIGM